MLRYFAPCREPLLRNLPIEKGRCNDGAIGWIPVATLRNPRLSTKNLRPHRHWIRDVIRAGKYDGPKVIAGRTDVFRQDDRSRSSAKSRDRREVGFFRGRLCL